MDREREIEMSMTADTWQCLPEGKPQQPPQHLLSSAAEWKNPMEETCEVMNDDKSSCLTNSTAFSLTLQPTHPPPHTHRLPLYLHEFSHRQKKSRIHSDI